MKNISKRLFYLLNFTLFFAPLAHAQFQLSNRLFKDNKTAINIGYAGEFEKIRVAAVYGVTSKNLDDAKDLVWQQAILDLPLVKKVSMATVFTNIKQGNFAQFEIKQAFAYKIDLSDTQSLSAGLGVSFNKQSINYSNGFNPNDNVDLEDPYLLGNSYSENGFDMEVGIVYKFKKLQVALGLPSLLQHKQKNVGFTAYTEYEFKLNEKFDLTPSVLMTEAQNKKVEAFTSFSVNYIKKASLQIGYSNFKQVVMGFGINYKKMNFAYNYSFSSNSEFKALVGNTSQFGLFFNI
ncbi:PorP/SprF family type IX secretion system membrane protein [Flavobacterium sp. ANB]|uniref:PorP/SprF family type IX secretion system membrane protein n=1 Tax=unclassified Flavobacterium TaxID=196869 RepID=UPI0012B7511C|nr:MULTISPECIES: PorP/SprF family type IX secretion system membrane protein [unclassified Flavobacterium]MBF4518758.1 PorP/SprF family type IX secretion system membrane protein [Flavobacterium sp. ANB]MTD71529.1 type IX secretion system membrane protein PorP/SprF [Flavobacterium sp. LC2016-13]